MCFLSQIRSSNSSPGSQCEIICWCAYDLIELSEKLAHWCKKAHLSWPKGLKFGMKVTSKLKWIHETFGYEQSVRLYVRVKTNSQNCDIFRSVRSRNLKFDTKITYILKWIHAKFGENQFVSIQFFVITISLERFILITWLYRLFNTPNFRCKSFSVFDPN